MTEEQRKWYLAGANDMEAGRLVTEKDAACSDPMCSYRAEHHRMAELEDIAAANALTAKEAEAEVESLREQLAVHERWIDSYGHPEEWVKRAQAAHGRAEAAEAKLAEDAHRNDQLRSERDKYRAKLAEVQERLDFANAYKTRLQVKVADAEAKLAEVETDLSNEREARWEAEKERDTWHKICSDESARVEHYDKQVEALEKERDAAEKGRDYYSAKNAERWASMDRARELAEKVRSRTGAQLADYDAVCAEIARLLSGDE